MNKLVVIVVVLGLAACGNKKPQEGKEPVQSTTSGAVVGSAVPAAPSAPPSAAAPGAGTGSAEAAPGSSAAPGSAAPAAAGLVGCASASTLTCEAGQRDGCTSGLTVVHVCVAADAKAGAPCSQAAALTCPAGQVDACLHGPPLANNHVCVIVPKPGP